MKSSTVFLLGVAALVVAGFIAGCSVDPIFVTGEEKIPESTKYKIIPFVDISGVCYVLETRAGAYLSFSCT